MLSDYSHASVRTEAGSHHLFNCGVAAFFCSTPIACLFPILDSILFPLPAFWNLQRQIRRCCHIARPKVSNWGCDILSWVLRRLEMGICMFILNSDAVWPWELQVKVFVSFARSMRASALFSSVRIGWCGLIRAYNKWWDCFRLIINRSKRRKYINFWFNDGHLAWISKSFTN